MSNINITLKILSVVEANRQKECIGGGVTAPVITLF